MAKRTAQPARSSSALSLGFLSCLHCGTREDEAACFLVLERADGEGDGRVCLARARRTGDEEHVLLTVGRDELFLMLCLGSDGAALDVVDYHSLIALVVGLTTLDDVYDVRLAQGVVFRAAAHEQIDGALKVGYGLLLAHHLDHIVARHDPELRIERLEHAQVGVAHAVEHTRVDLVYYYMFFSYRHFDIISARNYAILLTLPNRRALLLLLSLVEGAFAGYGVGEADKLVHR